MSDAEKLREPDFVLHDAAISLSGYRSIGGSGLIYGTGDPLTKIEAALIFSTLDEKGNPAKQFEVAGWILGADLNHQSDKEEGR